MKLQLHITGQCNLRCKHCYIEEHSNELKFQDFLCVMEQFDALFEQVKKHQDEKGIVHITGGEPLIHSEIEKILDFFAKQQEKYSLGILSNGTVLNDKILKLIKNAHPDIFQVSIDGIEATHDAIRGKGNLKNVLCGIDKLVKHDIPVQVSFTAHKDNFKEFPSVAALCREHGVKRLWSDRYVPFYENSLKPLTVEEMPLYVDLISTERMNPLNKTANLTIRNNRALQFILLKDRPNRCLAGEELIVVDENGNIMPCRRLPLVRGNVFETTLEQIYFNDSVFNNLRSCYSIGKCSSCQYKNSCRGGSRCFTYSLTKDYTNPDPCCWI